MNKNKENQAYDQKQNGKDKQFKNYVTSLQNALKSGITVITSLLNDDKQALA